MANDHPSVVSCVVHAKFSGARDCHVGVFAILTVVNKLNLEGMPMWINPSRSRELI